MQGSAASDLPALPGNKVIADILVYFAKWPGQHLVLVSKMVYQAVHIDNIADSGFFY
jgi:hypothetical protein